MSVLRWGYEGSKWRSVLQHQYGNCEGGFGLHAVSAVGLVAHDAAALGDVPRGALVLVRGINGVGCGLDVQRSGPERGESSVEHERDNRIEDVQKPEGEFDEVEEHAHNANVHVVVGVAVCVLALVPHTLCTWASIGLLGYGSPRRWYAGHI
jgi:hypothetical protein